MTYVHVISAKRIGIPDEYVCFPFFTDEHTVKQALKEFKLVAVPGVTQTIDGVTGPFMVYEYLGQQFSKVTYAGTVSFLEYLSEWCGMSEDLELKLE